MQKGAQCNDATAEEKENYTNAAKDVKQETVNAAENKLFSIECAKRAIVAITIVLIALWKMLEWYIPLIKTLSTKADT
eukprot:13895193-Ditylum_brightwellii.AAC.1